MDGILTTVAQRTLFRTNRISREQEIYDLRVNRCVRVSHFSHSTFVYPIERFIPFICCHFRSFGEAKHFVNFKFFFSFLFARRPFICHILMKCLFRVSEHKRFCFQELCVLNE